MRTPTGRSAVLLRGDTSEGAYKGRVSFYLHAGRRCLSLVVTL